MFSDIFQCDGNITIEMDTPENNCPISVQINKLFEASDLPIVVNLNPRSLYNKQNEFRTMIEQTEAGVCCVSETWGRSNTNGGTLISDLIDIEGYRIVIDGLRILYREGERGENWPF